MPKTRNIRKSTTVAPPVKAAKEGTQTSSSKGRASPVKREAALIPFPTPPRTTHKRKRARSRVTDSDDDDDDPELQLPVPDGEDHESASKHDAQGALILGNKKRKTLDAIAEELSEAQEEAFWLGTSVPAAGSSKSPAVTRGRERSRSRTRSPSSSPPPAPHLLRRQHTGLASPPPSRRQPRNYVIRNVRATRTPPPAPAPVSPKLRTRKPGLFPMRDSPDNPFLADATSDAAGPSGSGRAHTPESLLEKPTMTWVFRGKKVELANPHYRGPGAPPNPDLEASLLPPEHPDYSPPPTFAPKLLFADACRGGREREDTPTPVVPRTPPRARSLPTPRVETRAQMSARSRSAMDSDDEDSELPKGKSRALAAVQEEEEVDEAALQAAMANRLAHAHRLVRMGSSSRASGSSHVTNEPPRMKSIPAVYEPPTTRSRTWAAPRLPEKDSDQARRAMGPVRTTRS